MTKGLEGIPTMNEFIEGLNPDELFRGMIVLWRYCSHVNHQIDLVYEQLERTPETQRVECEAALKKLYIPHFKTASKLLEAYHKQLHGPESKFVPPDMYGPPKKPSSRDMPPKKSIPSNGY